MIEFILINDQSGEEVIMSNEAILTTPCSMVRLNPKSRKMQNETVRAIPPRYNFTQLKDVSKGLENWHDGDLATALQAHYITSEAYKLSPADLQITRVLTFLGGKHYSAEVLQKYLKTKAIQHHVDPDTVVLHGLRTGRVSDITNAQDDYQVSSVIGTAISGHVSDATQRPYVRLNSGAAKQATNILKF
jgi:hypothetical protein